MSRVLNISQVQLLFAHRMHEMQTSIYNDPSPPSTMGKLTGMLTYTTPSDLYTHADVILHQWNKKNNYKTV